MNEILSKAISLINSNNHQKAEVMLFDALKEDPNNFHLNKLIGISLLGQKKYNNALKYFNKSYEINSHDFQVTVNLSFLFTKVQNYELAIRFSKESIKINPDQPHAYQNLASCYLAIHELEEASKNIDIAIKNRGGIESEDLLHYPDLINVRADIYLANNDFDNFIKFAHKILETGSFQPDLFKKLLRHDVDLIKDSYIQTIKKILEQEQGRYDSLLERNANLASANFCLAEFYSKNDKDNSEIYFLKANKIIADTQRFSLFERQKLYMNIINFFQTNEFVSPINKKEELKGEGLIFVVGMPRSGTSLTESIIASGQNVATGGEKVFFSVQLNSFIGRLTELYQNNKFFTDLGDRYLENIQLERNNKKFFVDKLPENFLYYKFIKLALPGAKFINLKRDPWDNAISLFKEHYFESLFFASSFFGISVEIANYENLINFWKRLDGEQSMLEINYEKLVSNTSEEVSKIWEHCGLEGEYSEEKRMIHFSNTASKQQVKKKIFKTSINKFEFEAQKENFLENLENQRAYWGKKFN